MTRLIIQFDGALSVLRFNALTPQNQLGIDPQNQLGIESARREHMCP